MAVLRMAARMATKEKTPMKLGFESASVSHMAWKCPTCQYMGWFTWDPPKAVACDQCTAAAFVLPPVDAMYG